MNAKIRVKNLILFFAILLMLSGTFLSIVPKNIKASEDIPTNIPQEYIGVKQGYCSELLSNCQFIYITNSCNDYSDSGDICKSVLVIEPFEENNIIYYRILFIGRKYSDGIHKDYSFNIDFFDILYEIKDFYYTRQFKSNIDLSSDRFIPIGGINTFYLQLQFESSLEVVLKDVSISNNINNEVVKIKSCKNILIGDMNFDCPTGIYGVPFGRSLEGVSKFNAYLENYSIKNFETNLIEKLDLNDENPFYVFGIPKDLVEEPYIKIIFQEPILSEECIYTFKFKDEKYNDIEKSFEYKKGSQASIKNDFVIAVKYITFRCWEYDGHTTSNVSGKVESNKIFTAVYDYETIRISIQDSSSSISYGINATYFDDLTKLYNADKFFGRKVFGFTGYLYPLKGTISELDKTNIWNNGGKRLVDFKNFDKVEHGINFIYLYPIYDYMLPKDNPDYKEQDKDIFDDVADNIWGGVDFIKDIPKEIQSFFKTSLIIILVLVGFILIKFIIDIFRRK